MRPGKILLSIHHLFSIYLFYQYHRLDYFISHISFEYIYRSSPNLYSFLSITGRIKELLITAGGENVPPVLIEDEIKKELQDVISNVIVIGDRKKFLTCAVTLKAVPKQDAGPTEYPFTNELAPPCKSVFSAMGSGVTTVEDAIKDEIVKKFIHQGIEKANAKASSNAQRVGKFVILPQDFTIEGNELTPTMKLKRRIVIEKYNAEIEKMYEEVPGKE